MALGKDNDQGKKESTAIRKPILISLSVDLTGHRITN